MDFNHSLLKAIHAQIREQKRSLLNAGDLIHATFIYDILQRIDLHFTTEQLTNVILLDIQQELSLYRPRRTLQDLEHLKFLRTKFNTCNEKYHVLEARHAMLAAFIIFAQHDRDNSLTSEIITDLVNRVLIVDFDDKHPCFHF